MAMLPTIVYALIIVLRLGPCFPFGRSKFQIQATELSRYYLIYGTTVY